MHFVYLWCLSILCISVVALRVQHCKFRYNRQPPSPHDEEVRQSGDRKEIPRGKLSTGYFGPVMVSLLGASAAGPTCYRRANIPWLLINAGTPYSTHTEKTNMLSPLSITVIKQMHLDTETRLHTHTHASRWIRVASDIVNARGYRYLSSARAC